MAYSLPVPVTDRAALIEFLCAITTARNTIDRLITADPTQRVMVVQLDEMIEDLESELWTFSDEEDADA